MCSSSLHFRSVITRSRKTSSGYCSNSSLVKRDGQVRVIWDATPIDLFSYDAFQVAAGAARQSVPFADTSIPIVASSHLIVCKVIFNRPRDWVDVDAMLGGGSRHRCGRGLALGGTHRRDENPRYNRIGAVLTWT